LESNQLEEKIIDLILKYRDATRKEEYVPLAEREEDRENLDSLYDNLRSIRQKILDSRCYLEMGKLQESLSDRFLSDHTTTSQRLSMVSYLLRSLLRPIMFMQGNSIVLPPKESIAQEKQDTFVHAFEEKEGVVDTYHKVKEIDPQELKDIASSIQKFLTKHSVYSSKTYQKLSCQQAQIMSQMAASGDITITIETKTQVPENTISSVVLHVS
jgi:hypothetical protein